MKIEPDDFVTQKEPDSKKTATIIGALIVITFIILLVIIVAIASVQTESKLSLLVNGNAVNYAADTFIISEDGKIYVSIKDIAPLVGYSAHNGEYKIDVEDPSKNFVEAIDGTESASFYLNSKIISKVKPRTNNDYENVTIQDPIIEINEKLYTTSEGFTVGFNSLFEYSAERNAIGITTLPALVEAYSARLAEFQYVSMSDDFNNQKALIYGMIVASNESGNYGVITTSGSEIIGPRYSKIQFIESSGEFIVTNSNNYVGIAYSTGKNKISVSYDEIKVIDSVLGLYLVKKDDKYGVIDSMENIIVHTECDQIGINTSEFITDNIKNQYILYDKIIPVKINGKWRLLDTSGQRLSNDDYDSLGFTGNDAVKKVVNNTLLLGDSETIVVSRDNKYGGIDVKGNELIQVRYDAIYSVTSEGVTTYNILYNDVEYDALELINKMKEVLGYAKTNNDQSKEQTNIKPDNPEENTNNSNTQGNNTNNPEAESFNSQFSSYEGNGKAASQVRELLDIVIANNQSNVEHKVGINEMTEEDKINKYSERLENEKTYNISLSKNNETGYVNDIQITN